MSAAVAEGPYLAVVVVFVVVFAVDGIVGVLRGGGGGPDVIVIAVVVVIMVVVVVVVPVIISLIAAIRTSPFGSDVLFASGTMEFRDGFHPAYAVRERRGGGQGDCRGSGKVKH